MKNSKLIIFFVALFLLIIIGIYSNRTLTRPTKNPAQPEQNFDTSKEPEQNYCKGTECFRGIDWGENINNLTGLKFDSEVEPGYKVYTRKNENMKIGDYTVKYIFYYFYNGKFCSSRIIFSGYPALKYLKASLESKYGSLGKPNQFMETYIWGGNVNGILSFNEITNEGTVNYFYSPITDQKEEDSKNSAAKAKDSL